MSKWLLAVVMVGVGSTQGALRFDAPEGWLTVEPGSSMRYAEFVLPHVEGDGENASLIVYYFGGSGGSVEANLERWLSQVEQPSGQSSREVAKLGHFEADGGYPVTHLVVDGTYVAEVRPGSPVRHEKPGFTLEAAVVETPVGPYFVKVVGPAPTIDRWSSSIREFLQSIRYE